MTEAFGIMDPIAKGMDRCRHFAGLLEISESRPITHCRAGVEYASVSRETPQSLRSIPCFRSRAAGLTCPKAEFPTREEAEAHHADALERLRARFEAMARGECPHCKRVGEPRQIGRCVYGACGCRWYQGKLPKAKRAVPR